MFLCVSDIEPPLCVFAVMQISKLIEMEVLEEAHLNLLALRQEFQQELESCGEDSPHRAGQEGEGPQPPLHRPEEQGQRHSARRQLSSLQEQGAAGPRGPHHPGGGEESRGSGGAAGQLDGGLEGGGGRGRAGEGGERSPGAEGAEHLLAGRSPGPAG